MKNKIKLFGIIAVAATVLFAASCEGDEADGDGDGYNGDGSLGSGKSDWLWSNEKHYTVTDGVVGGVAYSIDVNWIKYTDDKNFEYQYSYTMPINTQQTYDTYSVSQTGTQQQSQRVSRTGNTGQQTSSSSYSYTTIVDYVNPAIQDTTTNYSSDSTGTSTITYDAESGLTLSQTYQSSGTNNGTPTSSNSSTYYSITLMNNVDGAKTYKVTISSQTSNGEPVDTSNAGYQEYTIKNGVTTEYKSYSAENTLSYTMTYSFPDDQTIRSRLPTFTVYSQTSYYSGVPSTYYSTAELLSSSSTDMVIRVKTYGNNGLSSQYDTTYKKR